MPQYAGFLRAINVGKRRVAMSVLARHMTEAGADDVKTVLASGNVVFSDRRAATSCARAVERHLADALGFPVPIMLRTRRALTEAVANVPFAEAHVAASHALYVGFAETPLTADAVVRVQALSCATDALAVDGRDIWWLRRARESAADIENGVIEKCAGQLVTFRTLPTVEKVLALLV